MQSEKFVDYYEVLHSNPDASVQALEDLFVELTQLYHPDVPISGNKDRFNQIARAYNTLRDPEMRREYDLKHAAAVKPAAEQAEQAISVTGDLDERYFLLKLFYSRRRENLKDPGLAAGGILGKFNNTEEVLHYHLWYLVERGLIKRLDGGRLAITANGVDKLETDSLAREKKAN